jgi:class 3 adenylate cyclase
LTHPDGNSEANAIGAEKMRNVMDTIFACLTDVISGNGGDVIKLAGDLVICTWTRTSGQSMGSVVALAAQARARVSLMCLSCQTIDAMMIDDSAHPHQMIV